MPIEHAIFFGRFKKHYGHYLLGIIIPACINGLSIPVFKNLLGATAYGEYALYFNGLLITNLLISGWLSQGVLRFYATATNKKHFAGQVFTLSVIVGCIAFVPAALFIYWQSKNVLTGFLFGATLLFASMQLSLQAITQSGFLSKAAISAEAIRTTSWFVIAFTLIKSGFSFLPSLFVALAISYLFSCYFLYQKNALLSKAVLPPQNAGNQLYKTLVKYGWPFSLWFILYYLTAYIDKVLMLQHFGPEVQGHYSALFDFLSKSLGLAFAPVVIAAVPLLTEAYETNKHSAVRLLLKKLILWEIAALVLFGLLYFFFGYRLLFYLLHIPISNSYIYSGLFILTGTMIWQIALLVHKPLELKLQSFLLLVKMSIAISIQVVFYYSPFYSHNPLKFPAGYCIAAIVYLILVLVPVYNLKKETNRYVLK